MTRSADIEKDPHGAYAAQAGDAFGHTLRLGRWGGVEVGAHWTAALTLVLFTWLLAAGVLPSSRPGHADALYWLVGLLTSLALLLSLLAHELAHAVCARHYGLRVRRIVLWMLGGVTEYDGVPPSPAAEAWIAFWGPLASIVIGGVCALLGWLLGGVALVGAALMWLAGLGVLLGVFNLLPGAPLDGGRVLRAFLWRRYHDRARATAAAARAGRVLGGVLIALGGLEALAGGLDGLWFLLIGWFVLSGANGEQYTVGLDRLRDLRADAIMTPTPVTAPDWWSAQGFLDRLAPRDANQPAFPVVDFAGDAVGLLTLARLQRVPLPRRSETRIRELAGRTTTVPVDAAVAEVAPLLSRSAVVVVDGRRPVGLITPAALMRAAELAQLARRDCDAESR